WISCGVAHWKPAACCVGPRASFTCQVARRVPTTTVSGPVDISANVARQRAQSPAEVAWPVRTPNSPTKRTIDRQRAVRRAASRRPLGRLPPPTAVTAISYDSHHRRWRQPDGRTLRAHPFMVALRSRRPGLRRPPSVGEHHVPAAVVHRSAGARAAEVDQELLLALDTVFPAMRPEAAELRVGLEPGQQIIRHRRNPLIPRTALLHALPLT